MSKELLKRVRDTLHELEETHYDLYWDIQTALDQPEPPITGREMYQRGYAAGVRFAEKAHGIGIVE